MTLKQFIDRYGATLVVVTVLVLLVALLPGNAPDRTTELGAGPALDDARTRRRAAPRRRPAPDVAAAAARAVAAAGGGGAAAGGGGRLASGGGSGAKVEAGKGPNCRPDGRMKGISLYAPPCVSFSGDNGGATAKGVTKDKILVSATSCPIDPATQAILAGRQAQRRSAPVVKRAYEALRALRQQPRRDLRPRDRAAGLRGQRRRHERRGHEGRRHQDRQRHQGVRGHRGQPGGGHPDDLRQGAGRAGRHLHLHDVADRTASTRRTRPTSSARCPPPPSTAPTWPSTSPSG